MARHIGLGLIVVVVADEVFDGVIGEEALELGIELGSQGFVVRHDQGGPLGGLHDVGDGEGLAGARRAQQGLMPAVLLQTAKQSFNRRGLIASGHKGRLQVKVWHGNTSSAANRCSQTRRL